MRDYIVALISELFWKDAPSKSDIMFDGAMAQIREMHCHL
ncbi:hypothetical protein L917_21596 [Phytophthora nicotianae]|uniref:Uncharacterized protein n=1 Tax=Phytophthora nicotianae TaxID=4792 RepID=W2JX28_PHYNI|nr:hypothetical protein L916_21302 [Phytophthora nicotianae]ETL77462.1 hypothetical protein L917_21596 [Phytophthora nicotianae]